MDWRYVIVMDLDTRYSPKFQAYSLGKGKSIEMKIHKTKQWGKSGIQTCFRDIPIVNGDLIYLENVGKQQKQQRIDGKWVPIEGVFEWWVNSYHKCNDLKEDINDKVSTVL